LEAEDASHGFLKSVSQDVVGDLPALGHQFVLKLCRIGLGQVDLMGMPTGATKLISGGADAALEGHASIVPAQSFSRGLNYRQRTQKRLARRVRSE
jgi:hypothetical protein